MSFPDAFSASISVGVYLSGAIFFNTAFSGLLTHSGTCIDGVFTFNARFLAPLYIDGIAGTKPHNAPPIAPQIAPPFAISHIVTSVPFSSNGCVAQNHAPTNPERSATPHSVFPHAINGVPTHAVEVASATSGSALPILDAVP